MNRLTGIQYLTADCVYTAWMQWTYDRYGNRWSQSVSGGSSSAAQPTFSFDMTTNHVSGGTYDAAGNLIQDTQGNTYTYDADGNLLTSTGGWGTTQSTYDALNRRVAYQSGASTTLFAFNPGGQRSAIYDGSENLLQKQVYWGSTPLAFIKAGTLSYQFQNWVGTEVFNVAPSSSQTQYASNPFGDGFNTTSGSDSDPLHYAGLDGDNDGTMHASYRNYNPTQAQWLSPDPSYGSYRLQNPQSFNRYAYAKNNPLSRNDPSGLDDGDWGDNGNPCDNEQECSEDGPDPCVYTSCADSGPPDSVPITDPSACLGNCPSAPSIPTVPGAQAPNNFQLASYNPLNPCSNANAGALDYNVNNAQNHILNNHVHIGSRSPCMRVIGLEFKP
jgi:RHS repeat-associated protein